MTINPARCPYCLDAACKYIRKHAERYGMIGMFKFFGCGAIVWDGEL